MIFDPPVSNKGEGRDKHNREIEDEILMIEGETYMIARGQYPRGQIHRSMKNYAQEVLQKPSRGVFLQKVYGVDYKLKKYSE